MITEDLKSGSQSDNINSLLLSIFQVCQGLKDRIEKVIDEQANLRKEIEAIYDLKVEDEDRKGKLIESLENLVKELTWIAKNRTALT